MSKERNYGIELLRIISICMIIMLHFLGHGGLLGCVEHGSTNYLILWLLETFSYSGVAIFATISGYVGWKSDKKGVSRAVGFIQLWMQVVFYSLCISLITYAFHREIGLLGIAKGLIPIATDTYWYFTAYFLLFLIMPLLNRLIYESDLNNVWVLIISFLAFMYFSHMLKGLFGLSVLMFCYVCGGILEKYKLADRVKNWKLGLVVLVLFFITYFWKIYISLYSELLGGLLIRYDSLTIICIAICSVLMFSKIRISVFSKRLIGFLASSAFACYLLNDHPYIREYVISGSFIWLSSKPWLLTILIINFLTLIYMILGVIIDKVRLAFFKLIKYQWLANCILRIFETIMKSVGKIFTVLCKKTLFDNKSQN